MIYDFHVHTSNYSSCGRSSAEAICRRAVELGFTGIALTEHNIHWPREEYRILQTQFPDLAIYQGVEYECPEGHFLVFLPEPEDAETLRVDHIFNLTDQVHQHKGLVIWAHPFRYDKRTELDWMNHVALDGMEVASNNMDESTQDMALALARKTGIRPFKNSDAHEVNKLGKYFNEISDHLRNTREVIRFFRCRHR